MASSQLITQSVGDVVVVYMPHAILNEANIKAIGEELIGISDTRVKIKLLLDFQKVNYLSSAVLGKLMHLHKKIKQDKGVLKLCNLKPSIMEVFTITNLHKVFDIYEDAAKAVKSFQRGRFFGLGRR